MARDWNIKARGHACSACGKPLVDKTPVVSALRELKDGYERHDCHPDCWKAGARDWRPFSEWTGVYEAPPPPEKAPIEKETADGLLRRLVILGDPGMANATYVLAVMLERSKVLVERDAREKDDGTLVRVYEHRRTGETFIVNDPRIRFENLPAIQQQVVSLLSGGHFPTDGGGGS